MAKQSLNLGAAANDNTGDTLRAGGGKINDNFTELYTTLGNGADININVANAVLMPQPTMQAQSCCD